MSDAPTPDPAPPIDVPAHPDPQQIEHDRVDWNLTNHRPTDAAIDMIEGLRQAFRQVGHAIVSACPPCRERSLALTALEEMSMWVTAAIARSHPAPTATAVGNAQEAADAR